MSIPCSNFILGTRKLDTLVERMCQAAGSSEERMQDALKRLGKVQESFENARQDLVDLRSMRFKTVLRCFNQLDSLRTLVTKPHSPFASPGTLRSNGEIIPNEQELLNAVSQTKRTVIGVWFAALNRQMDSLQRDLMTIAETTSSLNHNLVQQYRESNPSSVSCLELSKRISQNLARMKPFLTNLGKIAERILLSIHKENIDRAVISKTDLETFYRLLHGSQAVDGYEGIYDIYSKISSSLTAAAEENDLPMLQLFYTPSFKAIDLEWMEKNNEGEDLYNFVVLESYEDMIRGFLSDLNDALERNHPSPVKVLLVYSKLKEYMDAREIYVKDEIKYYNHEIGHSTKKIQSQMNSILEMRKTGTEEQKIRRATEKLNKEKQSRQVLIEDFERVQKMDAIELYTEARKALYDVRTHPQYESYLTFPRFTTAITFEMGHWLIDPIACRTIDELKQVNKAFNICDNTVEELLRTLKKGNSIKGPLISPLNKLEELVLGGEYTPEEAKGGADTSPALHQSPSKNPYAKLSVDMTEHQRQIFAAANVKNRNMRLELLNSLWKGEASKLGL